MPLRYCTQPDLRRNDDRPVLLSFKVTTLSLALTPLYLSSPASARTSRKLPSRILHVDWLLFPLFLLSVCLACTHAHTHLYAQGSLWSHAVGTPPFDVRRHALGLHNADDVIVVDSTDTVYDYTSLLAASQFCLCMRGSEYHLLLVTFFNCPTLLKKQ